MSKNLFFLMAFTASILFLISCGNEPSSDDSATGQEQLSQANGQTESVAENVSSDTPMEGSDSPTDFVDQSNAPKAEFLADQRVQGRVNLLQGEWLNAKEPTQTLLIEGNKMKYMEIGEVKSESKFEIHLDCVNALCKSPVGKDLIGWCITDGSNCLVVLRSDANNLEFENVATRKKSIYKKAGQ